MTVDKSKELASDIIEVLKKHGIDDIRPNIHIEYGNIEAFIKEAIGIQRISIHFEQFVPITEENAKHVKMWHSSYDAWPEGTI